MLSKDVEDPEVAGESSTESCSSPSHSGKSSDSSNSSKASASMAADDEKVAISAAKQKIDMEEEKIEIKKPEEAALPKVFTFTTSKLPQDPELSAYLQELLKDAYNKWCLDCKVSQSTHAIVYFGTFVCERCAN